MGARHTLLLRLIGPMQSWGHRSRFDDRDTALEPTRSGVIGLICAAMDIPREAELVRFDCLRMGVRVDHPGKVMTDYHTALDVIKADGSGRDTVVSWRHYLADARFTVGLESDDLALLREIEGGLRDPKWPLYLGRKSFPLTVPPLPQEGALRESTTLEEALRSAPWPRLLWWERGEGRAREGWRDPRDELRLLVECSDGEIAQTDWPRHFGERRFTVRRLTALRPVERVSLPKEDLPCVF
jgi:CRISPR system Cascade subunit CasD